MHKVLMTVIASLLAPLAFGQAVTATYNYNGLPIQVFQDSTNVISYARIYAPRSLSITNVTASVQVQYSGVGDLNVYLFSPSLTRTKLLERNCGSLVNIDTTFDDAATTKYASFCPAEAGRGPFSGNEPLSNFRGQNSLGYWTLAVENNGSEKTGFVTGFSVTVTGTALTGPSISEKAILNAASFKGGGVAPGELVGIFGVNLGPAGGITATSGNLPTTLGQTIVTFDGIPAPIYLVSDRLVVVQVPSTLTPGSDTKVQVQTPTGSSALVATSVLSAKPGLFTYEAGSSGQIKAFNENGSSNGNGSVNEGDLPAEKGSTITVLATGLGPVRPAISDGFVTPDTPTSVVTMPVTATIGGIEATVVSAVAAPGKVGTYYVQTIVPLRARSGTVPMTITVGGKSSQDDATIQIQ